MNAICSKNYQPQIYDVTSEIVDRSADRRKRRNAIKKSTMDDDTTSMRNKTSIRKNKKYSLERALTTSFDDVGTIEEELEDESSSLRSAFVLNEEISTI